MNKIEIIINDKAASQDQKKTAAFPRRRPPQYGRRRLNDPQIRFYDLGQVNHQSLDAEPVWVDHPILKTPSYTTVADEWGDGDIQFAGVTYEVEVFDDADYAAYTDMMFNYPVTEWRQRYRRIVGTEDFATHDYRFDMRFTLRDSTITGVEETFMPTRLASRTSPTFATEKESLLTAWHHYWDNDRSYAGYRDLDELTGQLFPRGTDGATPGGYFGYSNTEPWYKVTATNDFSAAAVDPFEPSGSYDIFLMPQIGMFLATAHSTDWKTCEVLGLCYQVNPRYLWPRYVEDAATTGTDGYPGSDSAVEAFLEYQKGRSGMQASTWTFTGVENASDFSYTESSMSPDDWTSFSKWGAGMVGGNADSYYSLQNRGRNVSDNFTQYSTSWYPSDGTDANFGSNIFRGTEPFLTAVIQKGSNFYYVWDNSHDYDGGFGNYSAYETDDQNVRYKLYRGISWGAGYQGSGGLVVRDGTGTFYDY